MSLISCTQARASEAWLFTKCTALLLSKCQTPERLMETGKAWIDCLQHQSVLQIVLADELEADRMRRFEKSVEKHDTTAYAG